MLIFANTGGQFAVPKPVDQKNYCLVRLIKTKDLKVVAKSRVLGDETDLLVNCDYDVLIATNHTAECKILVIGKNF